MSAEDSEGGLEQRFRGRWREAAVVRIGGGEEEEEAEGVGKDGSLSFQPHSRRRNMTVERET